ncbi:MAG: hypothetical protein GX045_08745 [Clostridiaceae bacterium]|jgi:hypothetical protein|nr:hypothetical protein [Clostridiaceae bacterium]
MEKNNKYLTIKKLVETGGNKKRASMQLNGSIRHINRMIKGYQQEGKSVLFLNKTISLTSISVEVSFLTETVIKKPDIKDIHGS